MNAVSDAELEHLRQQIKHLKAIERDYTQIKQLLDAAANNEPLDKFASNIVLYSLPDNGKIVDANPRALEFLGYRLEEILATTIESLEVPNSQKEITVYVQSSSDVYEYNCSFRHRQGYELPVHVKKWLIEKDGEALICHTIEEESLYALLWHELTRREDADYHFREKLKVLNEVAIKLGQLDVFDDICFHAVQLGIEKLGFDRISLWFLNPAKTLMIGSFGVDEEGNIRDERGSSWSYENTYTAEFVNGRREPFITHDNAPLYNEKSEIIGYGWHLSVPIINRGEFIGFIGTDNYINRQPLKNYQPELLRLYGATIGHLAGRQVEQETIRKLSSAVQHSSSMILVLNKHQIIEFANDAFCQVSGYEAADLIGQDLSTLFTESNLQIIQTAVSSGKSWRGEMVNKTQTGRNYETIVSISPVERDNTIENYVIVQEDISALKQSQKSELALQLEQERAHLLETFVTDISHEFKTPLAVINTSSFILSKSDDKTKRAIHSNMIKIQVNNLNQMLDDILEIVKITSALELEREEIRLANFIHQIVDSFLYAEAQKPLQWRVILDETITIIADAQKLARIVHEILENAVQFTPEKGTISVRLRAGTDQASIVVEDSGIGIAPEEVDRIFDRFYRVDKARSTRNTGLGLSIAKLLVDAHHGEIKVESVLGEGSRFEILLPVE